ncbi:tyrosine-type recombinase/integrase [Rhizobium tubonense]
MNAAKNATITHWFAARASRSKLNTVFIRHYLSLPEGETRITPHTLRHSAAMELLLAGVDLTVIALWLGHESSQTTLTYLHAHIALKEAALARVTPLEGWKASRFVPDDKLLSFLNAL